MKRTALISLAFLFAMATLAAAQYPEWLGQVQIVPPNPTSSDVVSITLSGEWHDSCIPNDSAVSLMADDIYFDVVRDYGPWPIACLPFCCPAWERTESVGPLPPGTYTVYACLIPDSVVYEPVAEFTVTGLYYIAVDGNDNNNGLSSQTAFATIQKGINTAVNGDTVIVLLGSYPQNVDFLGKNILLTSTNPADFNVVKNTIIGVDYSTGPEETKVTFSGTESTDCVLAGFNIDGSITGNHTHASISRCMLVNNRTSCSAPIESCDGTISNCIIAGFSTLCSSMVPGISECHGLIKSCTIANNDYGVHIGNGGTTTIENCIIYAPWPQFFVVSEWGTANIRYNDIAGHFAGSICIGDCTTNWGPGNIYADPCFADAGHRDPNGTPDDANDDFWVGGDYHLRSQAGHWDPNSQTWVIDVNTSYCIDAGNPGCPPANEPAPNGNRINMGAYGGTAEASKSPASWALMADLTNDHRMDFNDLDVFVSYWLECGENIPSDLDRSQCVDFSDLNIFAGQWAQSYLPEAGMNYEIGDCNLEAEGEASGEPNFSVWVEGRYIHFEDTMYANCCPYELCLEKEINGNQIKIYEIGYDGNCLCMCYFPVTATLGPFPDGTYTIEVFDNLGQSLGVVVVVIAGSDQPGAAYQIGGCSAQASAFSATEQADQTRFTVTVDGPYVHFEDMMVANCCPDELELQMTVEGNLIAIHEIEHISMPCRCTCEYPLTATLGPFDPGAYTLEVYQDVYYEGSLDGTYFVGSTTVTID